METFNKAFWSQKLEPWEEALTTAEAVLKSAELDNASHESLGAYLHMLTTVQLVS